MKRTLLLTVLGVIAVGIRLLYVAELRSSLLFSVLVGDSVMFDALARRILSGDWAGTNVYYEAQLYPYFLAAVYQVAGFDWLAVRTIQACLGGFSCVLLAEAGRRFFDARAGLAAGILLALYPPAIFFDGLIHKSGPDLFLMTLLLVALGACVATPRWTWVLIAGVAVGALSWNRENARVLFLVVPVWLLLHDRTTTLSRRVAMVLLFGIGAASVLTPVAIRNSRISGELFLTTSQFGPNFYIGNHAGASGGYAPLVPGRGNSLYEREDAVRIAENAAGRRLRPSEVSDYWLDRTLADIRSSPASWIRLLAKKTWLTFAAAEPLDTESIDAYESSSSVLRVLRFLTFGVVMALAVFGAFVTRREWRKLSVLYAVFLATAASVVLFFVFARYRYPLVPIALLFAGAGAASLPQLRRLPRQEWVPGCVMGVAALIVLHIPIATSADETFVNYGAELVRQGRPADAVLLLREAVRRDPGHPRAHLDLALALQQSGQDPLEAFDAAIRANPQNAEAHAGRAMALHQRGRTEDAVHSYREALRLKADSVEILSNLGVALFEAGRAEEGIDAFQRAASLQPQNVPLRLNLCRAMENVRSPTDVITCYRDAVAMARSPQEILETRYAHGQALASVGRISEAMASLQHALAAARAVGDASAVSSIEASLRLLEIASRR